MNRQQNRSQKGQWTPVGQVLACSAVVATYLAARALVYQIIPADDFAAWVRQDTAMNIPRALAAAASLWLGIKWYGAHRLGLHWLRWQLPLGLGLCYCSAAFVFGLFREPFEVNASQLAILTGSSFFVATFEEVMFRGSLFQSIVDWKGTRAAIWITTVIFAAYHTGAQPLWAFPQVVIISIAFATARYMGCSLFSLILVHALYDSAIFILQGQGEPTYGVDYWLWLGLLAVPLAGMLSMIRRRPDVAVAQSVANFQ